MGKILYGVMGDSGGHLSRSLAIARQLEGHEILFVGGGRVGEVTRHGYQLVKAPMLGTEVRGGRVDVTATALNGLRLALRRGAITERLAGVIDEFDPDLIVTDYEYFLPLAARKRGRPCISVDRQHVLTNCVYSSPPGHRFSALLTKGVIRATHMRASRYLISSFAPMQPVDAETTEIFPPVLRREVEGLSPAAGGHGLVYLYGIAPARLRQLLGGRARRFIIYGHDLEREEGNLSFRRHSVDGFLADLAGADYVISHGGHNLISEALHLGKPLLCCPIALEYEQYFNAHLLQAAGYGAAGDIRRGGAMVDDFEAALPGMARAAAAYRPWGQGTIAARLEQLISG